MEVKQIIDNLKSYNGRPLKIMEVCGTHTSAIFKNGIRSLISPKIKLISGPGCPVCVTPTSYIDKCIEFSRKKNHVLMTFGDMMKVPGSVGSLSENKERGRADIQVMYSPFDVIEKAQSEPEKTFVIAAVGFETTAPVYGLLLKEAREKGIENIKLLTALKRAIPALQWICDTQNDVDGFLCPGHVSVITGAGVYRELSERYKKPFVVSGFEAEHILAALYSIVRQIEQGKGCTENLYKNAVKTGGNAKAQVIMESVYDTDSAMWRGLGLLEDSGLYLRDEWAMYDVGSRQLYDDMKLPTGCRCGDVITGRIDPNECPMFGKGCSPVKPFGPCMVSAEGACGIWYRNIS